MPGLVDQGDEALMNLLGQGREESSGNFIEACGAAAPSLDDVRHSQCQVGLSSQEQHDWALQVRQESRSQKSPIFDHILSKQLWIA